MNEYYIGIDNGVGGAISILDENENLVAKYIMPIIKIGTRKEYDIPKIFEILRLYKNNSFCVLELAKPRPQNGPLQSFKTGDGYGVMRTILAILKISYEIVSPQKWQQKMFKGAYGKDSKGLSILFCQRKYPNEDWTATKRSRKAHDGMTDATCMALYGKRCLKI